METDEGKLNSELDEKIYQIYKDFLTRVTKFEELVAVGGRLLAGFQEGLEYLRRPPIDRTSKLVENIIKANETKRVKSYFEAGCINTHDGVHSISKLHTCQLGLRDHLSKAKSILSGLECLLEDATSAMQNVNGSLSPICIEDFGDGLNEQATTDGMEVASSRIQRPEITDFAALMGFIYSMLKQDYVMQEKIVSALNFKLSSGELESYCLMWSLRPFVNDEIMHQAWKLIP
ncbi:hypothetical protein RGQ29_022609 [Quercus rubra]|nr:hypothetical protein RGQ29_022609 [Quercus rubra]KAK4585001.1 hypothetical protein RGQ29_022609 [Quercus rubra]KAK4585002.1 hypothetical protein RGQ29_022609 [Quercus rubra]KAK4585003.1 hypothetical protein RGQ29_022609 [Quercus rubra]KAK4585004.1 hypothetical protein RGQ29_022609 [Quercus rubra]